MECVCHPFFNRCAGFRVTDRMVARPRPETMLQNGMTCSPEPLGNREHVPVRKGHDANDSAIGPRCEGRTGWGFDPEMDHFGFLTGSADYLMTV